MLHSFDSCSFLFVSKLDVKLHDESLLHSYIEYEDAQATSKTGLKVKSAGQLVISGTSGYIKVSAPWWLTREFEICYEDMSLNEKVYSQFKGDGLRYEISDFVSMVNGYGNNNFKLTREESVAIAEIMERFLGECKGWDARESLTQGS